MEGTRSLQSRFMETDGWLARYRLYSLAFAHMADRPEPKTREWFLDNLRFYPIGDCPNPIVTVGETIARELVASRQDGSWEEEVQLGETLIRTIAKHRKNPSVLIQVQAAEMWREEGEASTARFVHHFCALDAESHDPSARFRVKVLRSLGERATIWDLFAFAASRDRSLSHVDWLGVRRAITHELKLVELQDAPPDVEFAPNRVLMEQMIEALEDGRAKFGMTDQIDEYLPALRMCLEDPDLDY